ncbi:hypothetical protein Tsubulata_017333 [Turnera subulata]|uniref:Uncharacterized protein n=1 Tax=Turnera subulata TaxID=218843 RepID=A0A9Q0FVS6_9ROSI|nr:hypothetical protein Tsubulata_017333 [Turnera subulata]
MAQAEKAKLTSFVLFFLVFTSSIAIHSVASEARGVAAKINQAAQSHKTWKRMNHGSFRGPRKHLVNPTAEHLFQVPRLPV